MELERWGKALERFGGGLLMGLMIAMTIILGLAQLAISVPLLSILWLKRVLYRPPPLPAWARTGEFDDRLILRLAATLEGLMPGTMGTIAVAQAWVGDVEEGRNLLAQAEARLERLSRIPQFLRWDNSTSPEFERQRLDKAQRQFAFVLLGQDQPPQRQLEPAALMWVREMAVFGAGGRVIDPLRVLIAEGQSNAALALARAMPRDPVSGEPAHSLAIVAMGQLEVGNLEGAWATLEEAVEVARRFSNIWPIGDDSGYRERVLKNLAALQVHVGDLKGGRRTMALIYDQDSADDASRDAAYILVRKGEHQTALGFLWQVADNEQKARACVELAESYSSAERL